MKIHHVGYLTKDTRGGVIEFAKLGFCLERETRLDEERKIKITFLRNDQYVIELIEPLDESSPYWNLLKHYKNAPYHICYVTEDIEKKISELRKNGYIELRGIELAPCIDNSRVAFLLHNKIGMIELLEE